MPSPSQHGFSVIFVVILISLILASVALLTLKNTTILRDIGLLDQPKEQLILESPSFFYVKGRNIYQYELGKKAEKKLTDFPEEVADLSSATDGLSLTSEVGDLAELLSNQKISSTRQVNLFSLRVIEPKILGFGKCELSAKQTENGLDQIYGCGIFSLNLDTKQILTLKTLQEGDSLSKADKLQNVVWASSNKYAYTLVSYDQHRDTRTSKPGEGRWQLVVSDNGQERVLQDEEIKAVGNEYGVYENLSFSPNGRYLLQNSPWFPRGWYDFNTYIYDLTDQTTQVVEESAHPEWLNDENIVYNPVNKDSPRGIDSVHLYNHNSKTSAKLPNVDEIYTYATPLRGGTKLLFEEARSGSGNEIFYYDLNTQQLESMGGECHQYAWITKKEVICLDLNDSIIFDITTGEEVGRTQFHYDKFASYHNYSFRRVQSFLFP